MHRKTNRERPDMKKEQIFLTFRSIFHFSELWAHENDLRQQCMRLMRQRVIFGTAWSHCLGLLIFLAFMCVFSWNCLLSQPRTFNRIRDVYQWCCPYPTAIFSALNRIIILCPEPFTILKAVNWITLFDFKMEIFPPNILFSAFATTQTPSHWCLFI